MERFYLRDEVETVGYRCYLKPTGGTDENKETLVKLSQIEKYYLVIPLQTSSTPNSNYTDKIGDEYVGWVAGTADKLPQGNYYLDYANIVLKWGDFLYTHKVYLQVYSKAYVIIPDTGIYTLIASGNSGVYHLWDMYYEFGLIIPIPFEQQFEITDPNGMRFFISFNIYLVDTEDSFTDVNFLCEIMDTYVEYIPTVVTTRTVQNTMDLGNALSKVVTLDTRTTVNGLALSSALSGNMTNSRLVTNDFNLANTITKQALSHPDRTVVNTLDLSSATSKYLGIQRKVETNLILSSTIEKGESDMRDGAWENALSDAEDGFEGAL